MLLVLDDVPAQQPVPGGKARIDGAGSAALHLLMRSSAQVNQCIEVECAIPSSFLNSACCGHSQRMPNHAVLDKAKRRNPAGAPDTPVTNDEP